MIQRILAGTCRALAPTRFGEIRNSKRGSATVTKRHADDGQREQHEVGYLRPVFSKEGPITSPHVKKPNPGGHHGEDSDDEDCGGAIPASKVIEIPVHSHRTLQPRGQRATESNAANDEKKRSLGADVTVRRVGPIA